MIAWAQADLPTAPSGRVGALTLPDGAAWYAAALKLNTTTDLTADQIHATGLAEVKRIEGEQDALARAAGLKDRQAFYAEIARRFPVVPWNDELRAKYLKEANAAIAFNRTLLPKYFGKLPVHAMEVVREPSFSEVAGGAAHAAGPSPDGARPGRVYVHLLGTTDATPPSALRDLMCHEGVPGHVMQGDIQVGQSGGPKFRQSARYVAFGEGWGLYAEALCKEMGAYPEASRRLHAARRGAVPRRAAGGRHRHPRQGLDRAAGDRLYRQHRPRLARPGRGRKSAATSPCRARRPATRSACSRSSSCAARRSASSGRSSTFAGFHDLLIGSGSLPLPILERQVDGWIAARRGT